MKTLEGFGFFWPFLFSENRSLRFWRQILKNCKLHIRLFLNLGNREQTRTVNFLFRARHKTFTFFTGFERKKKKQTFCRLLDPSAAQIDVQFTFSVVETRAINLLKFAGNRGVRTFLSAFIVCAAINTTYYTLIVKRIEVQAAVLTICGCGCG